MPLCSRSIFSICCRALGTTLHNRTPSLLCAFWHPVPVGVTLQTRLGVQTVQLATFMGLVRDQPLPIRHRLGAIADGTCTGVASSERVPSPIGQANSLVRRLFFVGINSKCGRQCLPGRCFPSVTVIAGDSSDIPAFSAFFVAQSNRFR